jgi:hypothetical protein
VPSEPIFAIDCISSRGAATARHPSVQARPSAAGPPVARSDTPMAVIGPLW